jgi:hypothetical protein
MMSKVRVRCVVLGRIVLGGLDRRLHSSAWRAVPDGWGRLVGCEHRRVGMLGSSSLLGFAIFSCRSVMRCVR